MNRREFLRFSSTSSVIVGFGLAGCGTKRRYINPIIQDAEKIKIGIIGLGNRGESILTVLQNVPEIKVVAVCDLFDFRMDNAEKFINNKVSRYKDFEKLMEHRGLEAVIIATPLFEHFRMIMTAFDRELHILSEKALAYSIDECQIIKRKAASSNKLFQISYQYQLNPMFQTIKKIIRDGHIGKITRIEGTWDRNNSWRRELPDSKLVPEINPSKLEKIINWRLYMKYSGGINAELGSHQFNMIENILGSYPEKVIATGGIDYWKDGRETYDNVHVLFDHPGGIKVGFHSGTSNNYEGYQIKFYGDKATLVTHSMNTATIFPEENIMNIKDWKENIDSVTGASIKIINRDNKRTVRPIDNKEIVYPSENVYYNTTWLLYKNFASAIKGREELLLGLDEGYQSAISVHLANIALRQEKVVKWLPDYNV